MYCENVPGIFIYLSFLSRVDGLLIYLLIEGSPEGKPYQSGTCTIKTFLAYLFIYFVEGIRCIDLFSYRGQT